MRTKSNLRKIGKGSGFKKSGLFITFEGIEGCGKTTQCQKLAHFLRKEGYQVIVTREPGGTVYAEKIRTLLLKNSPKKRSLEFVTPQCEAGLILASRAQHVTHKILPALSQGLIVLCDRFSDSTLAYQGYGRGLDIKKLRLFNDLATTGLTPDMTLLFDLPVKHGLTRRRNTKDQNRIDRDSLYFHYKVRRGFLALAQRHASRITIFDGRKSPEKIAQEVAEKTHSFITRKCIPQISTQNLNQKTRVPA